MKTSTLERFAVSSRFTTLVIDCHEPRQLADFWCQVLGHRITDGNDDDVEIAGWEDGVEAVPGHPVPPALLFARVLETKSVKNRLHIEINPIDQVQDEKVNRLLVWWDRAKVS